MDALMNLGDGVDRRGNKVILPEAAANPVGLDPSASEEALEEVKGPPARAAKETRTTLTPTEIQFENTNHHCLFVVLLL